MYRPIYLFNIGSKLINNGKRWKQIRDNINKENCSGTFLLTLEDNIPDSLYKALTKDFSLISLNHSKDHEYTMCFHEFFEDIVPTL